MSHLQPGPDTPAMNVADRCRMNTKSPSERPPGFPTAKPLYLDNLFGEELGRSVPFAAIVRAVDQAVCHVPCVSVPPDVNRINASKVALAAVVRGFMERGWRLAVCELTDQSGRWHLPPLILDPAFTVSVGAERPSQAFLSLVRNVVEQKLERCAVHSAATARVAVTLPTPVVRSAPSAEEDWLATVVYGAYGFRSHLDLLQRLGWLGLATVLPTPRQSAISTVFTVNNQRTSVFGEDS